MDYKIIERNPDMKGYFDSLPPSIKENIIYSAPDVSTLQELQAYALNLMNKNINGSG